MANNIYKSSKTYRNFIVAYIMIFVIMCLNFANSMIVFYNGRHVYYRNMDSYKYMSSISDELLTVNREILMIISGMDNTMSNVTNIHNSFDSIRDYMEEYEQLEHSELETRRYNHAKLLIESYDNKLLSLEHSFSSISSEELKSIYLQEIHPTQEAAIEMTSATLSIINSNAVKLMKRNSIWFGVGFLFMIAVLLISEFFIHRMSKSTRHSMMKIEMQERQIETAGRKIQTSNQKMQDIALVNILTGMKNRYALEDDLSGKLESGQFNIGVFDIDNFRIINDTYGYEFGDEYLAAIGEMLTDEFSDSATIYNITSNEFCFVFNDDIPDSQAQRIADRIRATISTPITIESITVQCTASGSIYHYLPNDCLNVSSLLLKMDNVMHNAKRNGGNMIYVVNSL